MPLRSHRQTGGKHLLLQFAGAVGFEGLLEQGLYLTGFGAQHFGQHPCRIAVAGQGWLQVVDLLRQYGVGNRFGDRLFACLISRLEGERQMLE